MSKSLRFETILSTALDSDWKAIYSLISPVSYFRLKLIHLFLCLPQHFECVDKTVARIQKSFEIKYYHSFTLFYKHSSRNKTPFCYNIGLALKKLDKLIKHYESNNQYRLKCSSKILSFNYRNHMNKIVPIMYLHFNACS